MNKWLLGVGLVIFLLFTVYAASITIKNPTGSNIVITVVAALISIFVFRLFIKGDKNAQTQNYHQ